MLLTSHGLRSLAPDHPDYRPRYGGDVLARDGAYHQGTVWAWLLGPFALAHHRVYGDAVAETLRAWTRLTELAADARARAGGARAHAVGVRAHAGGVRAHAGGDGASSATSK